MILFFAFLQIFDASTLFRVPRVKLRNRRIKISCTRANKNLPFLHLQLLAFVCIFVHFSLTLFSISLLHLFWSIDRRAAIELAKDWRTDRYLRKLEAMMITANKDEILVISGTGDVLEPENGIASIGSGGNFALSAAQALKKHAGHLSAEEMVREGLTIAADLCIYTNHNLVIEKVVQ